MKAPCKNCTSRYVGCHSSCEKYITFQKEQEKVSHTRHLDTAINNYHAESIMDKMSYIKRRRTAYDYE